MADQNAVPEPVEKTVSPNAVLKLDLSFRGVAKYIAYQCTPGPSGDWVVAKTLEANGSSEDARLDTFEFNGPGDGERCNVWVVANMTSPNPQGDVELRAAILLRDTNSELVSQVVKGKLTMGGFLPLTSRIILTGRKA